MGRCRSCDILEELVLLFGEATAIPAEVLLAGYISDFFSFNSLWNQNLFLYGYIFKETFQFPVMFVFHKQ